MDSDWDAYDPFEKPFLATFFKNASFIFTFWMHIGYINENSSSFANTSCLVYLYGTLLQNVI